MIFLRDLFRYESLHEEGEHLSKLVIIELSKCKTVSIDFLNIKNATASFIWDFTYPIIFEFGDNVFTENIILINMDPKIKDLFDFIIDKILDCISRKHNKFTDISDISYDLLFKAREYSLNDPISAKLIFGLNDSMCDLFSNMDMKTIRRIANSGIICFEPRFSSEFASILARMDTSEIDIFLNSAGTLCEIYEPGFS